MQFLKRSWCEIDLSSLYYNINLIRDTAQKPLMAIVKANAYGHGDKQIARACQTAGITAFGVSNLNEALMLRKYGITGQILILSYTDPIHAPLLARHHLSQTVVSLTHATALNAQAKKPISVHLKLDTGMGRVGFSTQDGLPMDELLAVCALSMLQIDGIFSHFACADSFDPQDIAYTKAQTAQFDACVSALAEHGIAPTMVHLQNSAGIFNQMGGNCTHARAGIVLYGLKPSADVPAITDDLRPILSVNTVVEQVKTLPAHRFVSYGCTFESDCEMQVASLAVGYADGYPRLLSNRGMVLVQGVRCPIVGRVCMDQLMVDVSAIYKAGGTVEMGQTVTLVGSMGDERITLDELATLCDTINYELACNWSRRMPRVYRKDDTIIDVIDDSQHLTL